MKNSITYYTGAKNLRLPTTNNHTDIQVLCRYMFRTDTAKFMLRHNKEITPTADIQVKTKKNYFDILLGRRVLIGRSIFKSILMEYGCLFIYHYRTEWGLAPHKLLYIPNKPFILYKLNESKVVIHEYSKYLI